LLSQGEQRRAHFDHFKRRLDLCQSFAIPTLVVVADFVETVDEQGLERAVVSLARRRGGPAPSEFGGLEFRGRSTFCASLDTALAVVRACGEPNVGVCLDVFHYYTGPSKFEDLGLLERATWPMCRCATWPAWTRAGRRRRPHPAGEGDFQLGPIFAQCAGSATMAGCRSNCSTPPSGRSGQPGGRTGPAVCPPTARRDDEVTDGDSSGLEGKPS